MIHLYTQNNEINNIVGRETKDPVTIVKASEVSATVFASADIMSMYSREDGNYNQNMFETAATDVRNNKDLLAVLKNTMSADDYNAMMKDGYHPESMSPEETVNSLDEIKARLAAAGVIIEGYNDDLSVDEMEAVLGSRVAAEALEKEFDLRDLSINEGNIEDIAKAMNEASQITEITDGMCDYILRNAIEPTIDNLYRVRYCCAEERFPENGYFTDEYGHIVKDADINTDSEYFEDKILQMADELEITDPDERIRLVNEGMWLIKSRIYCNTGNLQRLHELRSLSMPLSEEETAASIANAAERGLPANKAELTERANLLITAYDINQVIKNSGDEVLKVIERNNKELTPESLREAKECLGEGQTFEESVSSGDISETPELIRNRRILYEAKLHMTVEANYSLLKRGMALETTALKETVDTLKALEDRVNRELFGGETDNATAKSALFKETKQVIAELPFIPARAVGDMIKSATPFTLRLTYETGLAIKAEYEKAMNTYEAVGTEVRTDLGDSIKKAFANVDDILKEEGLEVNDVNRKAVRILGYSETEITVSNIETAADREQEIERIINKMTPTATLSLIRDGVNPLEISLEELEDRLDERENSDTESFDNYASFLVRLDNRGEITEEEKQSFIGIYSLMDKIGKSDGKALAGLMKGQNEINFKNILTALRTGKAKGLDVRMDENFGEMLKAGGYEGNIEARIRTAFEKWVVEEDRTDVSNGFDEYQRSLAKDNSKAVEELEYYGVKVTPENIGAMTEILSDRRAVCPWKTLTKVSDELEDNDFTKEADEIIDHFTGEKEAKEVFKELKALAEDAIGRISETDITDRIDLRNIKTAFRQIEIMSTMTTDENYEVPVKTDDGFITVRVKITHKDGREGKVFASFETEEFGQILGQFGLRDGSLQALIAGDSAKGIDKLRQNIDLEKVYKEEGFEEVTFTYIQTDILNVDYFRQHFNNGTNDEVTNKQLYKIAGKFIETIKKAGN